MSGFSGLSIFHPFKLHKSIPTKQGQGCKKEQSFSFAARKRASAGGFLAYMSLAF